MANEFCPMVAFAKCFFFLTCDSLIQESDCALFVCYAYAVCYDERELCVFNFLNCNTVESHYRTSMAMGRPEIVDLLR